MPDKLVENTIPVLGVSDLLASIHFYTDVLGFELSWGGESGSTLCSMARDGSSLMLMVDEGNRNSCVWIGLENDQLFEYVRRNGARIVQEPTNQPWAYEMRVADPDGNILWLGTEPQEQ